MNAIADKWIPTRIGHEAWLRARLGWKGLKAEEYVESGYALLSTPDIKGAEIDFGSVNYITQARYDESPEIRLRPGDVLLVKDGSTLGTVNRVRRLAAPATVNSSIAVLTPGARLDGGFLYWAFQSAQLKSLIQELKGGMGVPHLFQDDIKRFPLLLPPLAVQRQISNYLDQETGKIDTLILKQNQLVDTLAERRRSTITHKVTRGTGKPGLLKAVASPWVSEIPVSWQAGNARHFASMKTGHTPSRSEPTYWENTSIPWFTLADVWQLRAGAKYLGETAQQISPLGLANSAADLLPTGTVVLSRTASVGFAGIMPRPMATSQDYWNWVPGPRLDSEYLWYQLQAMRPHLMSLMHGSTHNTIYQADAAGLWLVVPPRGEQSAIVELLDSELRTATALIENATRMIALLRERRQALISAAVTGEIDVRGL